MRGATGVGELEDGSVTQLLLHAGRPLLSVGGGVVRRDAEGCRCRGKCADVGKQTGDELIVERDLVVERRCVASGRAAEGSVRLIGRSSQLGRRGDDRKERLLLAGAEAFITTEDEESVFPDGAADGAAKLIAVADRLLGCDGIGGEARLGDHRDYRLPLTVLGREGAAQEVELLDGVGGGLHGEVVEADGTGRRRRR